MYATSSDSTGQNELPGLFALNAGSGEEVWRFTPDTPQLRRPPAVANGTVFAGDHSTWAIDAASGEELWSRDEDCFTKPVVADGAVYVWESQARAVDAATGDLLWEFDEKPAGTSFGEGATIVITDEIALLATYSKLIALEAAE